MGNLYGATHHHSARTTLINNTSPELYIYKANHPSENGPPPYPQADRDDKSLFYFYTLLTAISYQLTADLKICENQWIFVKKFGKTVDKRFYKW